MLDYFSYRILKHSIVNTFLLSSPLLMHVLCMSVGNQLWSIWTDNLTSQKNPVTKTNLFIRVQVMHEAQLVEISTRYQTVESLDMDNKLNET